MSLHFTDRAIDIIVEDKLATAYQQGAFDSLPGFGRPDPIIDEPYSPEWWIRNKLKTEGLNRPVPNSPPKS